MKLNLEEGQRYCARIVSINPFQDPSENIPSTYEFISGDNQLFTFIFGHEDLLLLEGLSDKEILLKVGYQQERILSKLSKGIQFHLFIFKEQLIEEITGIKPQIATWDGMFAIIEKYYPLCAEKLKPYMQEIKNLTFKDDLTIDQAIIKQVSSFEQFQQPDVKCDPYIGRLFFRHTMNCNLLYKGDGFTYLEDGSQGLQEYLIPRIETAKLNPLIIQLHYSS